MSSNEIHPYFTAKARDAFAKAGGDPERSGPLAAWAQEVRGTNDSRLGVIVSAEGEILARTRHTPAGVATPGATYVREVVHATDSALVGREVGLAIGSLGRAHGPAIHVRFSEVCTGAGRVHVEPAG